MNLGIPQSNHRKLPCRPHSIALAMGALLSAVALPALAAGEEKPFKIQQENQQAARERIGAPPAPARTPQPAPSPTSEDHGRGDRGHGSGNHGQAGGNHGGGHGYGGHGGGHGYGGHGGGHGYGGHGGGHGYGGHGGGHGYGGHGGGHGYGDHGYGRHGYGHRHGGHHRHSYRHSYRDRHYWRKSYFYYDPFDSFGVGFYYGPYRYYGYGYPYPYGYWPPHRYYVGRDPEDSMGALDINLKPDKTEIYLDGQRIGVADNFDGFPSYLWLEKGTYDLVFFKEGYQTLARQYSIYPGIVVDVNDRLVPGESILPEDLVAKSTAIRDERLRRDEERVAEAERRETRRSSSSVSRLHLAILPEDAAIYLDSEFLGTGFELAQLSAGLIVEPGEHVLEVVRPGFASEQRSVNLAPGQQLDLKIELSSR
jgi:PEGA domain